MDLFTAAGQADLQTVQELLRGGADVDQGSVVHLDVEDFSEELLQCLLCLKEPARRIQSSILGALECKKDSWLPCMESIYYGRPYAIKNQREASRGGCLSWFFMA